MRDFDKNFRRGKLFLQIWFAFIMVIVLSVFIFVGTVFYKVLSDPNGVAYSAGQTAGQFMKGVKDAGGTLPSYSDE